MTRPYFHPCCLGRWHRKEACQRSIGGGLHIPYQVLPVTKHAKPVGIAFAQGSWHGYCIGLHVGTGLAERALWHGSCRGWVSGKKAPFGMVLAG